jgi:peptide/nickel transport system permease protein
MALACFIVLVALIAICAFAPLIAPYDMATMDLTAISQSPSADHLFGTDDLGRDIFSRCLYGGRYSLAIGFLSTALALVIGIVIGACSAYFGGMADLILMRVLDLLSAMPSILLAIAISAVLGTGFDKLLIALSISAIVPYARQLRAKMLAVSQMEYVEAARAINCSIPRIMFIHVFPNAMTPVIVAATMGVAQQILSAATLAYIGLGVRPPSPEWGAMLAAAKTYIIQYPYMLIGPGVLIVISVLCINLVGDGIRDALDPKMKR